MFALTNDTVERRFAFFSHPTLYSRYVPHEAIPRLLRRQLDLELAYLKAIAS
jgi:hypothetical protein